MWCVVVEVRKQEGRKAGTKERRKVQPGVDSPVDAEEGAMLITPAVIGIPVLSASSEVVGCSATCCGSVGSKLLVVEVGGGGGGGGSGGVGVGVGGGGGGGGDGGVIARAWGGTGLPLCRGPLGREREREQLSG